MTKPPGGPPSYSESVWGLCLRCGYSSLWLLLCAKRYDVLPVFGELARAEGLDLGFGDGCCAVIEGGEVLVMRELRDAHLILDGAHPALYSFRVDQLFYRSGQTWRLARGQQIMCASCHSMQPQGGQLVDEGVHAAASSAEHRAS